MTRNKPSNLPKYRRQKSKPYDRAFVELNGQRIYLGRWDSPKSKEQYERLMADWLANGRQLSVAADEILINELLTRFIQHAELYYRRRDGSPTQEISDIMMSLRPVRKLFGNKRTLGTLGVIVSAPPLDHDLVLHLKWSRGREFTYTNPAPKPESKVNLSRLRRWQLRIPVEYRSSVGGTLGR